MDLPTTTLVAHLKRADLESLSDDGKLVFDFAVPGFSSHPQPYVPLEGQPFGPSVRSIAEEIYGTGNRRRYAPSASMDSGRYHSIAKSPFGSDGGTMRDELAAYRDPALSGHCAVLDNSDFDNFRATALFTESPDGKNEIRMILAPEDPMLSIFLYSSRRFLARFGQDEYDRLRDTYMCDGEDRFFDNRGLRWRDLEPGEIGPFLAVALDWKYTQVEIPGVLDLRLRDVQQWFSHYFSDGVPGLTRLPIRPSEFLRYLAPLMNPRLGGSYFTTAIGMWAVQNDVSGIVFPSARSDVQVQWAPDGSLADWGGWAFVDLRNKPGSRTAALSQGFEEIRRHPHFEFWLMDEEAIDLRHELLFMQETISIKIPNGFGQEKVRTLNDKIHIANYSTLSSRWRGEPLPLDDDDRRILAQLTDLLRIDEQVHAERMAERQLLASNAHRRPKLGQCDCCEAPIILAESTFALGCYLFHSPFRQLMEQRLTTRLGEEIAQKEVEKFLLGNRTPFALCSDCAANYLEEDAAAAGLRAAERFAEGDDVSTADLPDRPAGG